MGLLDDAIREHLDLKRRRGADPAEVARLEQEALGPVRREPAPAEPAAEPTRAARRAGRRAGAGRRRAPAAGRRGPPADEHTHVLAPEDRHEPPHGDPLFEQHAHNVELGGAAARRRAGRPARAGASRAAPSPSARPPGSRARGRRPADDRVPRRGPPRRGRARGVPRARRPSTRTCSRRRPTSCRRRRSTTGSGSSSAPRATSTSTDKPRRGSTAGVGAHRYTLLDVFTATPLEGNALAVVHDADDARRADDARASRARRA